jgi:hypothetical protein
MSAKTSLKILTIGNSFTDSLAAFFPQVVESAGCELLFERANHGGCELHRHWSYIENEEKDRVYRMYQGYQYKMRDMLAKEEWDLVTIQQASHFSWRQETYQPFATNIYNYIRQHAPQAEIAVQQTWAYRADDPRIRPGGTWQYGEDQIRKVAELGIELPTEAMSVDQTAMYEGLTAAYTKLAKELDLRIIPSGYAVQLTRENDTNKFPNYDPELLETLVWPDLPPQASDVVGRASWHKDAETGELKIGRDLIHLNLRGQYLQACVWFAFLYGRPTSEVTFVPDTIGNADAQFLREMAQQAVDAFPQVKK